MRKHRTIRNEVGPADRAAPAIGWWICLIVAAVVSFLVFLPALECSFNYDDEEIILANENYRGLGWSNIRWMFTTFLMGHYQPLTWLSLAFDHAAWGMNPRGYHLTNVLLHSANAALVFAILSRLLVLAGARLSPRTTTVAGPPAWAINWAALVAALLFAVHPLRVESVAWVTERRDVLSSFWMLAAVLLYLKANDAVASGLRRRFLAAAFVAFILSLLSRAMAVTLPVILLFLDWYPLGRLGAAAGGWFRGPVLRVLLEKLPFLAASVCFALIAPRAQAATGALIAWDLHGPAARVFQACYGLVFYLHKTVLPVCLAPFYELPLPTSWQQPKYYIAATIVIAVAIIVLVLRRRMPGLFVATGCYVILLAPVLGFVQSGQQEVADRYSYLPAICISLLVAAVIANWLSRPDHRAAGIGLVGVGLLSCTIFAALTWRQCGYWVDELTLWTHGTTCQPNSYAAQYNLGCALAKVDQPKAAVEAFQRSLAINSNHTKTRFNLGNAYQELGRIDEAFDAYAWTIKDDPTNALAWYELGRIHVQRGQDEKAYEAFREATKHRKDYPKANVNLGVMLARRKEHEAAMEQFRYALGLDPELRDAYYNMAISQEALGLKEDAIASYRKAIEIDPRFPDARVNLANILALRRNFDEAIREYEKALEVDPSHEPARLNLDSLHRELQRR